MTQPFFDESSPIHSYFPSREWALRIPSFIVVVGIFAMGIFLGTRIIRDAGAEGQQHQHKKTT